MQGLAILAVLLLAQANPPPTGAPEPAAPSAEAPATPAGEPPGSRPPVETLPAEVVPSSEPAPGAGKADESGQPNTPAADAPSPPDGFPAPPPPPPAGSALSPPPPPPPPPEPQAAGAASPAAPQATAQTGKAEEEAGSSRPPLLGLQLDFGLPSFIGYSLAVRPLSYLRFHAGGLYDFAGSGLRAGVTLMPPIFIIPNISLEWGRAFNADWNGVASHFSKPDAAYQALLRRFGYDYFSVQLGSQIAFARRFVWFVNYGIAWIFPRVHDLGGAARAKDPNSTLEATDPKIRLPFLALTTGLCVFVW